MAEKKPSDEQAIKFTLIQDLTMAEKTPTDKQANANDAIRKVPIFQCKTMSTWSMPDPFAGCIWNISLRGHMTNTDMVKELYTALGQQVDSPHPSKPQDQPLKKVYTDTGSLKPMFDPQSYFHVPSDLKNADTQDILSISKHLYGLSGEENWNGLVDNAQSMALFSRQLEEKAISIITQKIASSYPGVSLDNCTFPCYSVY
jgi:hypothetical protein